MDDPFFLFAQLARVASPRITILGVAWPWPTVPRWWHLPDHKQGSGPTLCDRPAAQLWNPQHQRGSGGRDISSVYSTTFNPF